MKKVFTRKWFCWKPSISCNHHRNFVGIVVDDGSQKLQHFSDNGKTSYWQLSLTWDWSMSTALLMSVFIPYLLRLVKIPSCRARLRELRYMKLRKTLTSSTNKMLPILTLYCKYHHSSSDTVSNYCSHEMFHDSDPINIPCKRGLEASSS